jgi:hypothetical protein
MPDTLTETEKVGILVDAVVMRITNTEPLRVQARRINVCRERGGKPAAYVTAARNLLARALDELRKAEPDTFDMLSVWNRSAAGPAWVKVDALTVVAAVPEAEHEEAGVCPVCGRRYVDPMTLNSTAFNRSMCYYDATGSDSRCRVPALAAK